MFKHSIHSYDDARLLAKRRLPGLVFDYIDGAAGEGYGEQLNRDAIRAIRLMPSVLSTSEKRDIQVSIFEETIPMPFGISPMGMCNLAWPGCDDALAQIAARRKIPLGVSTAASTPLEQMIERADGHAWFQLYFSGNKDVASRLMQRAKAAGYKVLVLTVDVPEVARRPRELRRGFTMPFTIGPHQFIDFALHPQWSIKTLLHGKPKLANFDATFDPFDRTDSRAGADWTLLEKIRHEWSHKLVVKGVLNPQDAKRMKKIGIDAIQVSNHGGRQLDAAPPPINALRMIRQAVGDAFPLFYDSGLRNGEDIVKAYAYGADFVFFGRAFSFAMAATGHTGVEDMATTLASDTSITLAQLGLKSMSEISTKLILQQHLWPD